MNELVEQIVFDAISHLKRGRDVAIFSTPTMYEKLVKEVGANCRISSNSNLIIRKAKISGEAIPHYNTVFIIDPDQIPNDVVNELKMVASKYAGKEPMTYYIQIYEES